MDESQPLSPGRPTVAHAQAILRERFGHTAFREGQEAALASVLAGRSLLVVMPTGSGKSLLYQLPALLEDGLTLVVSPLIALMKDQVDDLAARGVPATFINSSLTPAQQQERIGWCVEGKVRLLYVAPERFRSGAFLDMLRRVRVVRMAVDEAHCISEWGHDFRPDYRRMKDFRRQIGSPRVTALTATATPRVQQDIVESLGLQREEVDVHVHGFDRPNLALAVRDAQNEGAKNDFVLDFLRREPGPGIIYVGTRQGTEDLADLVKGAVEPRTTVYHAGLEPEHRTRAQEDFLEGKVRVAVATVAFGMGIDKRDLRFVLHYHYPGSVEQYYQEIGRAGRDGLPSRCVLLYSSADHFLREFFIDLNYPTSEQVESVYEALWEIDENPVLMTYRQIAGLCDEDLKEGQVGASIRLLDGAGVTQALSGDATAGVTLHRPGAAVLAEIRGQTQRRVLEALAEAFDIETPGTYRIELYRLAKDAALAEDQVRRALASLASAGHIDYEPPFRGRGVQKKVADPPPFHKVAIDWERQAFLRGLEEEKLAGMEAYIDTGGCRRRFILRYFGEQSDLACGTCDNCKAAGTGKARETGSGPARSSGREASPRAREEPRRDAAGAVGDIERAVLVCIKHLRFPLGISRTVEVVTGSHAKELLDWGLTRNPAYGRVGAKREVVKEVIEKMLKQGYLKREGEYGRPVLALTRRGEAAAEKAELAPAESAPAKSAPGKLAPGEYTGGAVRAPHARELAPRESAPAKLAPGEYTGGAVRAPQAGELAPAESAPAKLAPGEHTGGAVVTAQAGDELMPAADLDRLVRRMLVADQEEAKTLVEHLRMYHPRQVAERLAAAYDAGGDIRRQSRAVWAAGELCSEAGLALLLRAAQSETPNVRRLAASALGKVAAGLRTTSIAWREALAQARQTLTTLAHDAAPQVAQYAGKALAQFPDAKP